MEFLFFWVVFAAIVGAIASGKGRSFLGWTLLALLISPLVAGLAVLVVGSGRKCPFCGGGVPKNVIACRHCGRNLSTGRRS